MIARNVGDDALSDHEYWYVEFKGTLQRKAFNHGFRHLRWIVCWEFDKSLSPGSEFEGIENDTRVLTVERGEQGRALYFLDSKRRAAKIQIIKLKELIEERLGVKFESA